LKCWHDARVFENRDQSLSYKKSSDWTGKRRITCWSYNFDWMVFRAACWAGRTHRRTTHQIQFVYGSFKSVSRVYKRVSVEFDTNVLFTGIIVSMASLLSLVLRKIRQPKVIAEVLGGILLGLLYLTIYA
jgi:hypothetical protein